MADVREVPRNGYRVLSTFSGCGGSCLGFEMAGFEVVGASEFVPVAAQTYRANHPGVLVDTGDVRALDPERWMESLGIERGVDVMEGSPPCASFSTSGRRSKGWGQVKAYSDRTQRTDDLFYEFARVRDGVQPKVFVAENVAGLVKGVSKGYFKEILARLREGYRVEARVLDAQWLGVPQARSRLIFVGVRDDLDAEPAFPSPLPYRYGISDVLPGLRSVSQRWPGSGLRVAQQVGRPIGAIRSEIDWQDWHLTGDALTHDPETGQRIALDDLAIGRAYDQMRPGRSSERYQNLSRPALGRPAGTITATTAAVQAAGVAHPTERRKFTLAELRVLASFPEDFVLTGTYAQRAERIGRAVPPLMMAAIAEAIRDDVLPKC